LDSSTPGMKGGGGRGGGITGWKIMENVRVYPNF